MTGGGRAIVIGAGIAGVTAARVLADRFERVLVLDRDPALRPRTHVPHEPHTHILGAHGYRLLCNRFEGFDADLAAAGAPLFDYGECPFFVGGQWVPRGTFGLVSRSATRFLVETALRRSLVARPNVELATGQRAIDYVAQGDRVTAVRLDDGRELAADLVVDAAGLGSKTARWLAQHGYPVPTTTEVDLDGKLVSQLFRPAPGRSRDWVILFVRRSGDNFRQAAISWVEGDIWRVSIWGIAGMHPPADPEGIAAFTRAIATPVVAEHMVGAEPVSPPAFYSNSWSQWIHYEQLARLPEGLVVIGDATFHPNYEHAQGMTFCAMTAELLAAHLDRGGSSLDFQRDLGALFAPWWDWNLAVELAIPGVKVTPAPELDAATAARHERYRALRAAARDDAALWKTVLEANQGLRSPLDL